MATQEEKNRVRHRDEAVELIECYLQRHDLAPTENCPVSGKCVICGA